MGFISGKAGILWEIPDVLPCRYFKEGAKGEATQKKVHIDYENTIFQLRLR